jgi:lipopolysaccharide/colanic/teichoic acid biosynthesis glycosyltransferase
MPDVRRVARYLTLLGPLAMVLAFSKYHAAVVADPPYDFTSSFRLPWAIAYAAFLTLAAYGLGLPDLPRDRKQAIALGFGASIAGAVPVSIIQLLTGDALLPRLVVLLTALALVPYHTAVWALSRRGRSRDEDRDRVVLVGTAAEMGRLQGDLALVPERPAVLVAHLVPAEPHDAGERQPSDPKALVELVAEHRATLIVIDRAAQLDDDLIAQAAAMHEVGIRVRTLVQFYEEWLGKLPVGELERASLFFDISELHRDRYGRVKRMLDLTFAAAGLLALAVVTPVVVLGNLVRNRGPLLYRQERVGRGGDTFQILKFRTMKPDGGDVVPGAWTAVDDPRITSFGRLLRTTHLDELPQVLNILRGELSVVGPRPEQPRYVSELSAKLPFYGMRHLVRPGLTGWAQVKYGYAGDESDALEKLQYEFFYLRHQGLGFDLRVIGRTLRSVAGSEGRGR